MTAPPADMRPIAPPPKPFQFLIRDVALVMLLVGLLSAGIAQESFLLLLTCLGTFALCLAFAWKRPGSAVGLLVGALLLAALMPVVLSRPPSRGPSRRGTCNNNLRQIALALHNYHDAHGSFPPAYIADDQGRPMHSWRVLLLPYLEQQALYQQYRFDEPWDGPNNHKLAQQIIQIYCCPSDHGNKKSVETSYVAIVGPGTAWPGERASKMSDFNDGVSQVLLVVEVRHSGIHWMEPRDLHISQMAKTINPKSGQGISSMHPNGAQAAFADGSVHFLTDDTPPDSLRSLIYVDDGTTWPPD